MLARSTPGRPGCGFQLCQLGDAGEVAPSAVGAFHQAGTSGRRCNPRHCHSPWCERRRRACRRPSCGRRSLGSVVRQIRAEVPGGRELEPAASALEPELGQVAATTALARFPRFDETRHGLAQVHTAAKNDRSLTARAKNAWQFETIMIALAPMSSSAASRTSEMLQAALQEAGSR